MSMAVLRQDVRPIEGRTQGRSIWSKRPTKSITRSLTSSSIAPSSSQMVKSAIDFNARRRSIAVTGSNGNPVIARTHPRPLGLKVTDGAGRMRSWVHSRSSFDLNPVVPSQSDNNSKGLDASGRSSIRADSRPETATGNQRRNSGPGGLSDVAVTSVVSHVSRGGGRPKKAGAADMRKFVARVKW